MDSLVATIVGLAALLLGLFQYLKEWVGKYEKLLNTNDKLQDEMNALKLQVQTTSIEIQRNKAKVLQLEKQVAKAVEVAKKYYIMAKRLQAENELLRNKIRNGSQ